MTAPAWKCAGCGCGAPFNCDCPTEVAYVEGGVSALKSDVRANAAYLHEVLESHGWQWRKRLLDYIEPRLSCSRDEKIAVFEMIWASVNQGQDEGMAECIKLVGGIKAHVHTHRDLHVVGVIEKSIVELRRRNARSAADMIEHPVEKSNSGENQ